MTHEWIPVGTLGDAFEPDNNCLPLVADLAGRTCILHLENGATILHCFSSDQKVQWKILEGHSGSTQSGTEAYTATNPRPGIYFVDFLKESESTTSVSLVLDFNQQAGLALIASLPSAAEVSIPMMDRIRSGLPLTGVKSEILQLTIDKPFDGAQEFSTPTADLIGHRIEYRYSKQEVYEHIYLNSEAYTWHCLEGSEQGLTDSDACFYYKIGSDFYLFAWKEKLIPTLGVICIDLQALKTTGKIFGYETHDLTSTRNFPVGAYAKIVHSKIR